MEIGIYSLVSLLAMVSDALSLLDRFFADNRALQQKIDSLTEKSDEQDLRGFRAACSAFKDAFESDPSEQTKSDLLNIAHHAFRKLAELDQRRTFGPVPATRVLTISHAGLAKIYETRGDKQLFRKHVLLVFCHAHAEAREKLFPEFYNDELKNEVEDDVMKWYRAELQQIELKDYHLEAERRKHPVYREVTTPRPYGTGPYIWTFPWNGTEKVFDHWEIFEPEKLKRWDIEATEKEKEKKLDEACIAVASRKLT